MFRQAGYRLTHFLADLTVLTIAMLSASWLRTQLPLGAAMGHEAVWLSVPVYALVLFAWGIGFLMLDIYDLRKNLRALDELSRVTVAHIATVFAFSGLLYFSFRETSRLQILYFAVISWLLLITYRVLLRLVLRSHGHDVAGARRVLIIGAGAAGREVAQTVLKHHWTGLRLVGFVDDRADVDTSGYSLMGTLVAFPNFGNLDRAVEVAREQKIDEAIIALPRAAHEKLAAVVVGLQELRVNIRVVPDVLDLAFVRSVPEEFGGMPLITLREPVLDPMQRFVKRVFDLIIASALIDLTMPLMLVIAIAIKLDSHGPVVFKQRRVGQNGRLFSMYKFRSMVFDAEAREAEVRTVDGEGTVVHKMKQDPRVTRVGRFIRRLSLDELPQLFNVMRGDMSLVGPRPELPQLVDNYEPWQRKRFEVPQGMTGWWQVNGRAEHLMHMHTEDDLQYIRNYSLWLDIQILWKTILVVLARQGAF